MISGHFLEISVLDTRYIISRSFTLFISSIHFITIFAFLSVVFCFFFLYSSLARLHNWRHNIMDIIASITEHFSFGLKHTHTISQTYTEYTVICGKIITESKINNLCVLLLAVVSVVCAMMLFCFFILFFSVYLFKPFYSSCCCYYDYYYYCHGSTIA